jgi:hypothetical protein
MFFAHDVLPPDVQAVLDTAAMLDISEFEVFQMSFSDWHGHRAQPDSLESYFVAYMFQGTVPYWVRQFTRKVHKLAEQGRLASSGLAPRDDESPPYSPDKSNRWYLLLLIPLVVILLLLSLPLGHLLPSPSECYFPPIC